ncbi:MAG: type III-B CRISPR-associated protein Cas10/Cmr2 [Lentisphaeria bacterium]
MSTENEQFWKNKLFAFLHDPPNKALDIGNHEETAKAFMQSAGFSEAELKDQNKFADCLASSIDRFPFPSRVCSSTFTGKSGTTFTHPFSSNEEYEMNGLEKEGDYQRYLQDGFGGIKGSWKERFFLYWRRWLENAVTRPEAAARNLAFFPADTRIPDHTIWTHLSVTSALEGCREGNAIKPAFLIFQAGPVQDFIAAARSTRDLWSGSYMLSWLTGNALKAITNEVGPDSIIFPMLRGNGIFDILNKDIYDNVTYKNSEGKEDTLWHRLYNDNQREQKAEVLLNPALPNRFFAIVPENRAEELAQKAEKAFRTALNEISESTWLEFVKLDKSDAKEAELASWKKRWDKQVELLPEISWQVMPVETNIDKILATAEKLPAMDDENSSLKTIKDLIELATKIIPQEQRDKRYYTSEKKDKLNLWGVTWALNYALCDYALAARRNTRDFSPFVTDEKQAGTPKDALTGKEEIIGSEAFWAKEDKVFKNNEGPYGAISIIKRLWCFGKENYLFKKLDIDKSVFEKVIRVESVGDVAKNNKAGVDPKTGEAKNPYVAIIALDGDEMGKWMSGENAPLFKENIAENPLKYFEDLSRKNSNNSQEREFWQRFNNTLKRPLTPSYHLQFSEALSNYANHVAGKIVKAFEGQLIYAGGDDVLAMVPATRALECAQFLRAAFRADKNYAEKIKSYKEMDFAITQNGFAHLESTRLPILLPGMQSDVSCGITIAHKNYPLQRMVKEAQKAEKRAKSKYNRGAFAISLLKRGGEIVHWGAKWEDKALDLFNYYCEKRSEENSLISARFPYALAGLLKTYKLDEENTQVITDLNMRELIEIEFSHVMQQQIQGKDSEKIREELKKLAIDYLDKLSEKAKASDNPQIYADFAKLFLTAAFIERERGE